MTKAQRTIGVIVPLVLLLALVIWTYTYLLGYPPTVQVATTTPGEVNVTMQTVAQMGTEPHPPWVSYLIKQADGSWVHTSLLQLPAHTKVHMTIEQYDSGSDLRNPLMNQVQGVTDAAVNGQPYTVWTDIIGHTFTIPELGDQCPAARYSGHRVEPLQRGAVRHDLRPQHDHVHVRDPGSRHVHLAVLRALCGRVHRRVRRPDVDGRIHERRPEGGGLMAGAADPNSKHLSRIALIWLVLARDPHADRLLRLGAAPAPGQPWRTTPTASGSTTPSSRPWPPPSCCSSGSTSATRWSTSAGRPATTRTARRSRGTPGSRPSGSG